MIRRALCIFLAVVAAMQAGSAPAAKPEVGSPAPEFTLNLLDGDKVTLSSLRGEVVVLNYWATWCGPCKAELPLLDAYYKQMQRHGLRVFAITTEDSVPLNKMKKLTDMMSISVVKSMRGDYGILGGLPTNYVIDRSGVVRYAKAGAFDLDALNAILVPLLQESPPMVSHVADLTPSPVTPTKPVP